MFIYPNERCGLFIDGANFCLTAKRLGMTVDFRRFLSYFRTKSKLVTARYYSLLFIDENDHCSLRRSSTGWTSTDLRPSPVRSADPCAIKKNGMTTTSGSRSISASAR